MTIKAILYILFVPLSLYALQSLNYEKFLKSNRIYQARILFLMMSLGLSYLCVNFFYDFFINSRIM